MNNSQPRNETDVREDIATPLLHALGYARGTENDILREYFLRYDAIQLGHKKANDLPSGGRADYLLVVSGAGRWVLETKPPDEDIDTETIDQVISYAQHPEVRGHYAAVLNGKRFVLFDRSKSSNDLPLVDLDVCSVEKLAGELMNLLSPGAIRRDCGPPIVDLALGIAKGFRSKAEILGGEVEQLKNWWVFPNELPLPIQVQMKQATDRLIGYSSAVTGGGVWRDDQSRIRAKLKWHLPNNGLLPFMEATKWEGFEYICLDEVISCDPEKPTIFELLAGFRLDAGMPIFDVFQWKSQILNSSMRTTFYGQVYGHVCGDKFGGMAKSEMVMQLENLPAPISFYADYKFSVRLEYR